MNARVEIVARTTEVAGLPVHWRQAGEAPVLYLHGVPTSSFDWIPFLERHGGVAPDLPGFGRSAKPGSFDYSIAGYDRFLESFVDHAGLERFALVMHDWGGVGLALAQRFPERVERLVLFSTLPLLPGFEWHRVARGWRTPVVGELMMGFTRRFSMRRELPARARRPRLGVLRPRHPAGDPAGSTARRSRSCSSRAGERLGELRCPALVLWPTDDPYFAPEFGRRYADALGGEVELELVEGGHWSWHARPELVARATSFLGA